MRGERYGKGESGWGRMKRVRNIDTAIDDCPSCAAKDARIKELEDAVRWAAEQMSGEHNDDWKRAGHPVPYADWFASELLRRATEGGKR